MHHWMFNCKEVTQRVSRSFDQKLSLAQRMLIWMHLRMCKYCRGFVNRCSFCEKPSAGMTPAPKMKRLQVGFHWKAVSVSDAP